MPLQRGKLLTVIANTKCEAIYFSLDCFASLAMTCWFSSLSYSVIQLLSYYGTNALIIVPHGPASPFEFS